MSSLEEWQKRVDEDFPHGALCCPKGQRDSDGTGVMFQSTCLTIWKISDNGLPVLMFWKNNSDRDFRYTILSYNDQESSSHKIVEVKTVEGQHWLFSDAIPERVYSAPDWQRQRQVEREMSLGGGI